MRRTSRRTFRGRWQGRRSEAPFYELPYFEEVYATAEAETDGFARVDVGELARVLEVEPRTLLVFRTVLGLTRDEFAHSTTLAGGPIDLAGISGSKVDGMERNGMAVREDQARVVAETIAQVMAGMLFGDPPGDVKRKQAKPDTAEGWTTVERLAREGVPYAFMLHQRHYGGAFRQVLDATSTQRGNLIEDAVEALFADNGVPYVRTGSHNQGDIEARFGVCVAPAPDFVVFDETDTLRAMLECKGANDGGTARDKALRFKTLHEESVRLGGIPLLAVLGGIGWRRVNDTLGPVVRDTDGRVFTVADLPDMLNVAPFPSLTGIVEEDYWPDRDEAPRQE
ncbi:MAG TPA: hypothetical protein VFD59_08035 [Nocardioidaceae bacterium]|nr:hypothetical protein [Nocardioidaceae bacterium]